MVSDMMEMCSGIGRHLRIQGWFMLSVQDSQIEVEKLSGLGLLFVKPWF